MPDAARPAQAPRWTIRSGADLGRAIADIRRTRRLTQEEAASRGGVKRSYLAQMEAGRTVSLLEHMLRILRRMGATITITLDDDAQA
jgi:transcriptional regulator with XRE-family HTH domain